MIKQIYRKDHPQLFIPSNLEKSIDYYQFSDYEAGDGGVFYSFERSISNIILNVMLPQKRTLK